MKAPALPLSPRSTLRRHLPAILAATALTIGTGVAPAAADELEPIAFSNDELLIDEPGTLTELAEVTVSAQQVGRLCTVTVVSRNQASVHRGNDLVITSGAVSTVIPDVESEANAAVDLSVDIILGPTITVELRMGPDWVSSLGFELRLSCDTGDTAVEGDPLRCADTQEGNPGPTPGDGTTEGHAVDDGSLQEQAGSPDCSSALDRDEGPDSTPPAPPPPPVEVPMASPLAPPEPCPDAQGGSLTIDLSDCPAPVPEPATEPEPSTPLAPTEPATPEPEPEPAAEAVPTIGSETGPETGAGTDEEPEVLGIQVERLPQTPAAPAIPASPAYNG